MKYIDSGYTKFKRQWGYRYRNFRYNMTPLRFLNTTLAQLTHKSRPAYLNYYPRILSLELTNICNLKCVCCPTDAWSTKRKRGMLSYENFVKIMDEVKDKCVTVILSANGESFLNPDVFKMIRYLTDNRIGSIIHTNFNLPKPGYVDKMLDAGLQHLILSIDGASEETYSAYRRGGDFNKVIANVKELIEKRKKRGLKLPFAAWQFIVMKQNEHEIDKARRMAKEIGVDDLIFDNPFIPSANAWLFDEERKDVDTALEKMLPEKRVANFEKGSVLWCFQAYTELHVDYCGNVVPCCVLLEKDVNMGNIFEKPFDEVWNGEIYINFRKQLKEQGPNSSCAACVRNHHAFMKSREQKKELINK